MERKISDDKRRRIADAFLDVVDGAMPVDAQHKHLDPKLSRWLSHQVERLSYDQRMRFGGSREEFFVMGFSEVAKDRDFEDRGLALEMATKYRETQGMGYVLVKCQSARGSGGGGLLRKWYKKSQEYRQLRQHRLAWFYEQLVAGEPLVVADFVVEGKYSLVRDARGEPEHVRMVKLLNARRELTPLLQLNAKAFSEPRAFREWCLTHGHYTWGIGGGAGITELNMLQRDLATLLFGKTVLEQCELGWREVDRSEEEQTIHGDDGVRSGLWFFGDCVCTPMGEWLVPDDNGIVEWNGERFRLGESSYDNQAFAVGAKPKMEPERRYQDLSFEVNGGVFSGEGKSDEEVVRTLFQELYRRLVDTLGSDRAGYVLGSMLSYVTAPEIYGEYNAFPGLWIHGQAGSGKSSLAGWLMELWGFREMKPLILKGNLTTAVGLNIALSQISDMPLWGDEYRVGEVGQDKLAVLHNAYNRGKGVKWAQPGMERRNPRTSFLVSGETTSTDAATRGRYCHILVAAALRRKDHMLWWQNTAPLLRFIGRYLLENRRTFVRDHIRILKAWMKDQSAVLRDERQRFVYGVGYSAFLSAVSLFESHGVETVNRAREATVEAAQEGVDDVVSDIAIHQFWQDVVTLFKRDELSREWVRFARSYSDHPPGAPDQGQWESVTMYILPSPVIAAINEMRSRSRGDKLLNQKDLAVQMGPEPYWESRKNKRRMRFGKGASVSYCWKIRLDFHPLGYQRVEEDEFAAWNRQATVNKQDQGDPRLGELYEIYESFGLPEQKTPTTESLGFN